PGVPVLVSIQSCPTRRSSVLLGMFHAPSFDVVVLSMAIQMTHRTERVLREMSEVGREGIVSLPNFGHWTHAWPLLRGRMPVSREDRQSTRLNSSHVKTPYAVF